MRLVSTLSGKEYPLERLDEYAENGESLEVQFDVRSAKKREGKTSLQRYSDFLPFAFDPDLSLGEGDTPLLESKRLAEWVGIDTLLLKNETANPTWSFKDRGSLACILFAKKLGEKVVATISTGNMGSSMAAYGARAGIKTIVFIPSYCPEEKIRSMAIHGATIVKVEAPDYGEMKRKVMGLSEKFKLRIVSGNGPIRTEGYKFSAFEFYERGAPDFIAVPTSACGHIRGVFKGFRELKEAGLIEKLPRMIIVQAAANAPLVRAFKEKKKKPVPFTNVKTVASAITTGNPMGGDEILHKAYQHKWLAEEVSEEEILAGQRILAEAGFFVEPSSAASLFAVKKLRAAGQIKRHESVALILTGGGLKDTEAFRHHSIQIIHSNVSAVEADLKKILS